MYGYQETAGRGVARLDTRLKNGLQTTTPVSSANNVTITISADDDDARDVWDNQGTAELWEHVFSDAVARGGLDSSDYTITVAGDGHSTMIDIGKPGAVNLETTTGSYSAILQEITTA